MAGRSKVLFSSIVGARQILDLITGEQSIPIASSDLAKVGHGSSKLAQLVLLFLHSCQKLFILLFDNSLLVLPIISQNTSRLM
jgi:hypothetical protein